MNNIVLKDLPSARWKIILRVIGAVSTDTRFRIVTVILQATEKYILWYRNIC